MADDIWRIDSHVHLWDAVRDPDALRLMPPGLHGAFTTADLVPSLDESHVAGVVLIEAGTGPAEAALQRANAEASDRILGFVAYADPHGPTLDPMLESLAGDPKFRGVRFRFEGMRAADLDEPRILTAARAVVDRDLVLELLVTPDHLPTIQRIASRLPDLRGVVDHLAKPDLRDGSDRGDWLLAIRSLAAETGLVMKLSVSPRSADLRWLAGRGVGGWTAQEVRLYLADCVDAFGPDRVMWGSDWPVAALGGAYVSVAELVADALGPLDPEIGSRIFAQTARRTYRLTS